MQPREPTPSLKRILLLLYLYKGTMAFVFLAVLGGVAAVTLYGSKTYRSQAKLFVRLGRENVALDPTAALGSSAAVSVSLSRETELNSVVEILRSQGLADKVVHRVGASILTGKTPYVSRKDLPRPTAEFNPLDEEHQSALRTFQQSLKVEAVKRSSILLLSYESHSAELAREVVACLVDYYLEGHVQFNRTAGTDRFVSEQAIRLRNELTQFEETLRQVKSETGLVAPDVERQILVTRTGRLKDELLQVHSSVTSAEAELALLKKQLQGLEKTEVSAVTRGMPDTVVDLLRGQLHTLMIREIELKGKHPERHPDVLVVQKQIAAARELLKEDRDNRQQVTSGPNQVYVQAQLALQKQEAGLAALRARETTLDTQLTRENARLEQFTRDQLRLVRLQRDVDLREAQYRKYADALEQTRIDGALAAERISNINIVEPPTLELKAVRPKASINLGLGAMFGLLTGAGVALARGLTNRRLYTISDVEQTVGLPVLATIPRLDREQLGNPGRARS